MSQGLTVYFMHFSIFITVSCDIGDISLYILITMFSFPLSLYTVSSKSKKSEREMFNAVHRLCSVSILGTFSPDIMLYIAEFAIPALLAKSLTDKPACVLK